MQNALYTIGITVFGLFLAILLVSMFAFCLYSFRINQKLVLYYLVSFRSLPVVIIAPFVMIWFGSGMWAHLILSCLAGFFALLLNVLNGLYGIDIRLHTYVSSLHVAKFYMRKNFLIPSALPNILVGLRISASLCLIGSIVGEFVASSRGLGYVVKNASYYSDSELMMCAIFCTGLFGFALYVLIGVLEKHVLRDVG